MRKKIIILVLAMVLPLSASADMTYWLHAQSTIPWAFSDFDLTWNDTKGDGRVQLEELTSFTGLAVYNWEDGSFFSEIVQIPTGTYGPYFGGGSRWDGRWPLGPEFWAFIDPTTNVTFEGTYNAWYYTSNVPPPVPVPPTVVLLGSGLLGLGVYMRHKKS